jgi:alpha-galactosidase
LAFSQRSPGEDSGDNPLDPSVPEVLEMVRTDIKRLSGWGFELIKHDFSTFDIFGQWGVNMKESMTRNGWHFADRTRTSAEIVVDLYRAIREAAGDTLIIGCNTIGHLAAGLVELQRTGDDTSGREWERTRRYGINTLAFRMAQHGAFFAVDADCVGLTNDVPWNFNAQWLDLLARSGTPLFVSASP